MNMLESRTTRNVAAGQVAGTGGVAGILLAIRQAFPQAIPWPVELDAIIIAFFASTVSPWISRQIAFWFNPEKNPANNHQSPLPCIAFFCIAALGLQGCATALPAVGGKTHYKVEFSDVTTEQATNYTMDIKAPAGVDLASVTGMTYDWRPDGSGAIAVSQQGTVNSDVQAGLIAEVSRQQVEAFKAGLDSALNALAPFIGQYLDARVREGEIRAGVANNAIDRIGAGR